MGHPNETNYRIIENTVMATPHSKTFKLKASARRQLEKAQAIISTVMVTEFPPEVMETQERLRKWNRLAEALQNINSALKD